MFIVFILLAFTVSRCDQKPVTKHAPVAEIYPKVALVKFANELYGGDEIQQSCLNTLWTMESHWNYKAKGSKTRLGQAWGIPQALPGKKMAKIGADWKTNPLTQIKWGVHYIKTRYGKACYALKHELNKGWY